MSFLCPQHRDALRLAPPMPCICLVTLYLHTPTHIYKRELAWGVCYIPPIYKGGLFSAHTYGRDLAWVYTESHLYTCIWEGLWEYAVFCPYLREGFSVGVRYFLTIHVDTGRCLKMNGVLCYLSETIYSVLYLQLNCVLNDNNVCSCRSRCCAFSRKGQHGACLQTL